MKRIRVDGATLSYIEAGQGEPLLLLHGYPQSHHCWRHQLDALAQTHRVIAPDWFGWGESERSFAMLPEYAAESARIGLIADALGLERFNLAGHDYGGFLALGFALGSSERLLRLAILNSRAHRSFTPAFYAQTTLQCAMARTPLLRRLFAAMPLYGLHARELRRYVPRAFDEGELERYVGWLREPEGRRWLVHFYRYYDVRVRPGLDAVENIRVPAAVIWGERDVYCDVSIGRDLAARIPGAALTVIPEAGHFSPEEAPGTVTRALQEWLARPI